MEAGGAWGRPATPEPPAKVRNMLDPDHSLQRWKNRSPGRGGSPRVTKPASGRVGHGRGCPWPSTLSGWTGSFTALPDPSGIKVDFPRGREDAQVKDR